MEQLTAVGYLTLGISNVSYRRFSILTFGSVLVWSILVTTAGYLFGHALEAILGDIKHLELPLLAAITIIAVIVIVIERRHPFRA